MPALRRRRSMLFAPASDPKKLAKASQSAADAVIVELEDGVAVNLKIQARASAADALHTLDFGGRERLIRVNVIGSAYFEDDLRMALDARPDTVVLPKVNSPADVQHALARMDAADPDGAIGLIAMIESPRAVLALRDICEAGGPRLNGLMFGAEDYASMMGATRTREAWEVFYARSALVTACAAYGLDAIDMVCNEIDDHERLKNECRLGRQMSYAGKQAIHPLQLDVINRYFSPSADEVAQAKRIVDAAASRQLDASGAFLLDGRMVDAPIVRQAERVLALAR